VLETNQGGALSLSGTSSVPHSGGTRPSTLKEPASPRRFGARPLLRVGAGQSGLATSYWLSRTAWSTKCWSGGVLWARVAGPVGLILPEHSQLLVHAAGLTYDVPWAGAFLPRDAVIDLFRGYVQRIAAVVQLGTEATRIVRRAADPARFATLALVGDDAPYVAEHIAGRNCGVNVLVAVRWIWIPG
jgi:putative flavoprotein involved in K+ transport